MINFIKQPIVHLLFSIITSVATSLIYLVLYVYIEINLPLNQINMDSFIYATGIFSIAYIALSVIGWLLVGIPSHLFLYFLNKRSIFYYLMTSLLVPIFLVIFIDFQFGLLVGMAGVLQALVFWFVYYKVLAKAKVVSSA